MTITTMILIWSAILYYVFCVFFLYESLNDGPRSLVLSIITLICVLIIAPLQVPILLGIYLGNKWRNEV